MLQSKTLIHRMTKLEKLLKAVTVLIKYIVFTFPLKQTNQIKLRTVVWKNFDTHSHLAHFKCSNCKQSVFVVDNFPINVKNLLFYAKFM